MALPTNQISLDSLAANPTQAVGLSNLILVTPNQYGYWAQLPTGVNASSIWANLNRPPIFLFDYEGDQNISLQSDITDHYTEANVAVQDQISIKPVEYTTHGFVSELNDIPPLLLQPLQTVTNRLTNIESYAPQLTVTAELAYAKSLQAYQAAASIANAAVSAWNYFYKGLVQNNQQKAFNKFYGYWNSRTLFTIYTPWQQFQNMAIKSLRAIQDSETRMISDFEITFKQITYVVATINGNAADALTKAGQLNTQAAPSSNLGSTSGQVLSSANSIFSSFTSLVSSLI